MLFSWVTSGHIKQSTLDLGSSLVTLFRPQRIFPSFTSLALYGFSNIFFLFRFWLLTVICCFLTNIASIITLNCFVVGRRTQWSNLTRTRISMESRYAFRKNMKIKNEAEKTQKLVGVLGDHSACPIHLSYEPGLTSFFCWIWWLINLNWKNFSLQHPLTA